jgi:hypothetical protein
MLTGLCAWCERPIATAVEADGKRYCQKLCAAQGLVNEEIEAFGISGQCGELNCLLDRGMFEDGVRNYGVRVRWSDGHLFVDGRAAEDREGFFPICVPIDDDKTPDWIPTGTPSAMAQAWLDGDVTVVFSDKPKKRKRAK